MTVTIYHNPRCSKSRQTLDLLTSRGIEPRVVEYLKTPPTAEEIRGLLARLGLLARDLVRRKEAAEAGLDLSLPDDALVEGMAANPAVIERPIVVNGDRAALGRPPEAVLAIL
ncbi:arsenate reductase (glutaredoxin) [Arenibaculum sp.]|uniref:arsenate reductase (glutaredoxin) n=1 Tax=Arenibaculum sp. TaxID=2865862 RepID=UPI002E1154B5|nr:arsenate reductase (glutaredoxin) [Arenibaculum sp.]HEV7370483.1 arsenate reductase (glutaredoxin) [Arenibaculum sp.]